MQVNSDKVHLPAIDSREAPRDIAGNDQIQEQLYGRLLAVAVTCGTPPGSNRLPTDGATKRLRALLSIRNLLIKKN